MADQQALISEMQKRGLLNDQQLGLVNEMTKRGLLGGQGAAATEEGQGSAWDYVPVVSQVRDAIDIAKQGVEPSDQFPYFRLPDSIGDRAEKRDDVARIGAGLAAGGAGGAVGAGMAAAKGLGLVSRAVGSGIGSAGGEAAADASRGKFEPTDLAQAAALGSAGHVAGEALGAVPNLFKKALRGGTDVESTQAAIDDLARFDAVPSLAQATESPLLDAAESLVAKVPGGTGVIRKAADETSGKLSKGVEGIAERLAGRSGADPEMAGIAITKGIDDFAGKFRKKGGELYDEMRAAIPDGTPAPVSSTLARLDELTTPVAGAEATSEALTNPKIKQIADAIRTDAATGAVPFDQLLRLRSAVGRQLTDTSLIADVPRGELKQLYGALSEDIGMAANAAGAGKIFNRANSFYAAGMQRIDNFLDPLAKKNVPEQVFMALERGGKNGATQLRAIRKSVEPEQWRAMGAAAIRRLGKATPGQQSADGDAFSFNTFLRNWSTIDDNAKSALFSGKDMFGVRSDLDAIARAAGRIKESSQAFANPPNTASTLVGSSALFIGTGAALTGNFGLPMMLGMASLASNVAAKLMINPKFVKWLATETKRGTGAPDLTRLALIGANEDEETRAALDEYEVSLRQSGIGAKE